MTYRRRVAAQISRLGQEVNVLERVAAGANSFGNTQSTYVGRGAVLAFRTYPNRNTDVEHSHGDRDQDRAVFIVPVGDNQPDPPAFEDRIVYDGKEYEVGAHTTYDTHVEFFGDPVIH